MTLLPAPVAAGHGDMFENEPGAVRSHMTDPAHIAGEGPWAGRDIADDRALDATEEHLNPNWGDAPP